MDDDDFQILDGKILQFYQNLSWVYQTIART